MAELHHKVQAVPNCDVEGCREPAERSISAKRVSAAGLDVSGATGGSAHLCKKHYRDYKKKSKKDRDLERLGW